MIPHESLGKDAYNVSSFNIETVLQLLLAYPCVYYTCGGYGRASEQASNLSAISRRYNLNDFIVVRRVGRRVVAERGPEYNPELVQAGWDHVVDRASERERRREFGTDSGRTIPPGSYDVAAEEFINMANMRQFTRLSETSSLDNMSEQQIQWEEHSVASWDDIESDET
jgi:hypothetical protein